MTKSVSSKDRICVRGEKEVQILGINSGCGLISSKNKKIEDSYALADVTVDEDGEFWISVYNCSILRVP